MALTSYLCIDGNSVEPGFPKNASQSDWEDVALQVNAVDVEDAAETYLEQCFADLSNPRGPVDVYVREQDGTVSEVEVSISWEPTFHGSVPVCVREATK